MKKILFINSSLTNGGSERVMCLLANELVKKGYTVSMVILYPQKSTYIIDNKIKLFNLQYKQKIKILKKIEQVIKLEKIIGKDNYDTVIAFMESVNILTLLASKQFKGDILISERCYPLANKNIIIKILVDKLYPRAKYLITQTDQVVDMFSKKIRKKCKTIPNPVNPNILKPYSGIRENKIVAVGRLTEQKNFSMLIKVFARLEHEYSEYILEIYGQGKLLEELKKECKELKIEEKVKFKGYTIDVNDKMRKAAMYVSSSNFEGISNSMIEALAMGIPTVCTDCPVGGASLMIKNNVNGILIPVNDEDALYEAMKKILDDKSFAKKISENAIKIKEKYSAEKIINKWIKLIND